MNGCVCICLRICHESIIGSLSGIHLEYRQWLQYEIRNTIITRRLFNDISHNVPLPHIQQHPRAVTVLWPDHPPPPQSQDLSTFSHVIIQPLILSNQRSLPFKEATLFGMPHRHMCGRWTMIFATLTPYNLPTSAVVSPGYGSP